VPPPFWGGEAGSPSNTMSPGPMPTSIPSGILIHPAVWRQRTWAKNWGVAVPLLDGELGPHLTQCGHGRGLPCANFHLDPSSRLATIHQRYRQTGQDRQIGQRSDSIGRTVLQTIAQKLKPCLVASCDVGPGNGEGLFLFQRFINLSLTYLLT